MLNETPARALRYDGAADVLTVVFDGVAGSPRDATARLLLDDEGHLVGVDLRGDPLGVVVMLGPHERVARTADARVKISPEGDHDGVGVQIGEAASRARAEEPSPYIGGP